MGKGSAMRPVPFSMGNLEDMGRLGRLGSPPRTDDAPGLCKDPSRLRGSRSWQRLSTVMEMPNEMANKYLAHERLLVLLFTQRQRLPVLADPLARWRTGWRILGVVLLLLNAAAISATSWAHYRCGAAGPLLRDEDGCSDRGSYGKWRADVARSSGLCVRAFSAGELLLGLTTASAMPKQRPTLERFPWDQRNPLWRRASFIWNLQYGTTIGPASAVLVALDVMLLLPLDRMQQLMHGWDPPRKPERKVGIHQKIGDSILRFRRPNCVPAAPHRIPAPSALAIPSPRRRARHPHVAPFRSPFPIPDPIPSHLTPSRIPSHLTPQLSRIPSPW